MLQGARQLVGKSVASDLLRAGITSASPEVLIPDSDGSVKQAPAAWDSDTDAGRDQASAAEVYSQTPSSDRDSATVTGRDDGDRAGSAPSQDNETLVSLEDNTVVSSIVAGAQTLVAKLVSGSDPRIWLWRSSIFASTSISGIASLLYHSREHETLCAPECSYSDPVALLMPVRLLCSFQHHL